MSLDKQSLWSVWWTAIRPRTLGIAVAPVLLGSALSWGDGNQPQWLVFIATLICALLIQIGTNLHNDVVDFQRGTDRADRVGPVRVTAAGWVSASAMHRATLVSYGLAVLVGGYLVEHGGWPILLAGIASVAAGWSYSGGARPVSHTAWGEVFVWVFFGLVAVGGSHWLQTEKLSLDALLCGAALGLPAAAVLLVNNYRDLDNDVRSGRRTLVAVLGRERAQKAYACMLLAPFALIVTLAWRGHLGALLALLALPYSVQLITKLHTQASGASLNLLLAANAKLGLILGVLLSVGVAL